VSGKFAGIHCPPNVAKKLHDLSNHHNLLAKVLVPDAKTICKREVVGLHIIRPEDFEPGVERLKAGLKLLATKHAQGEAQVIKISAKVDGTILELFDGDTSIWKAGDR
jgi:hypothetical protein